MYQGWRCSLARSVVGFDFLAVHKIEHYEKAGRIIVGNPDKRKKYSEGFNEIFSFFLQSYKCNLLTFGGEGVDIDFDINGPNGKEVFKQYENGRYKNKTIFTKHPNIVRGVIIGKKSWGLHVKMWSEGINEQCFTKYEILNDFTKCNIKIPKFLVLDFDNWVEKKRLERYK